MAEGPRQLPHDFDAEAAVLGAILLQGEEGFNRVADKLRAEDFYVPAHQAMYRGMLVLADKRERIDPLTLNAQLRATDEARLVGGLEKINQYCDHFANIHNMEAHAGLIRNQSQVREMVLTARAIADEGMGEVEDVRAFMNQAEAKILEINESGRAGTVVAAREVILEVFRSIEARSKLGESITGVPTQFKMLDEMTAGLQATELIILAARPSMGKTAFALNIAQNACIQKPAHQSLPEAERPRRYPVLFFSLEMGAGQLIERILASEARVDATKLRRGQVDAQDYEGLIAAADRIAAAPLYIDDTPAPTIMEIAARARRWRFDNAIFPVDEHGKRGLGLVMVDYLQLARGAKGRYDSREQEISEISRGLKGLAKELNCPVIALSQLNRAVDSRSDHRPMLSDLRESGAIEQDADVIMFIYRGERYLTTEASEEERRALEGKAELIVGKQRNGPIGTVHLTFVNRHTRFENPTSEYPQR